MTIVGSGNFLKCFHNTKKAYYEALFRAADVQGGGSIGGAQAVQFFARSKLPVEVLKNIWTVADQPSTSSLDHAKFAVALRLIQLTQNGQKGQGANLAQGQQQQVPPTPQQANRGMLPQTPGRGPPYPQPQQQMRPPPLSPQRGPAPQPPQMQQQQPPPTPNSRALVGQDPYVMTPQERARYEALFPQYAKPDGYVYGQEAVALFMKSGVQQNMLRDIWNMVDRPVDNRLDKLEFAIAMHLIVCISKKNLPAPQGGALPNSLLALKASAGPGSVTSPPRSPARAGIPQTSTGVPLSPMPRGQQQMPSPQQMQQQQHQKQPLAYHAPQVETVEETPMVGAPAIVAPGGMSISDAFEGLTLTSDQPPQQHSSTPMAHVESRSLPSYIPEAAAPEPAPLSPKPSYIHPHSVAAETESGNSPARVPARKPVQSAAPSLPDASSYDLGDAHSELDKLKSVLQKLQAENISLKAQLGSMSDDEKEVQKELGAVVAEIGRLSSDLTIQRQKVLEAKNRLLEASAELKAHQEHKG
jgi:hypothetical protein